MTQPINDGFVQLIATGGETSLSWDFKIGQYTDIKIIRTRSGVKATLVLNTDYTIAANQLNQPGGGIANLIGTATPALAGDIYTLLLDTPSQRLADFSQQGAFQAATVNAELDNLTRMAQRLTRDTNKSLKYDENLNIPNAIITEAIDENFAIVGGATSGTFKKGPSTSQISNAAADAISAAASAATAQAASVAAQAANGGIGRVVRLATSGNVTLSGLQTIDGVVGAAGDRILVRAQTTSSQNGIYLMASGAWTRATDANTWSSFVGMIITVAEGTARKNHVYISLATQGGTLGATAITFDTVPIDGHVTTPKIADGAVTAVKIADANVTTAKIADGNVTNAKLATPPPVYNGGTAGGTANALTLTIPGFSSTIGATIVFFAGLYNTGATTVNINGTGAVNVVKPSFVTGTTSLSSSELITNVPYIIVYNGTNYVLQNPLLANFGWFNYQGLIIQWGSGSVPGSTTSTFNFATTFPTTVLTCVVGLGITTNTAVLMNDSTGGGSISTSQYQVRQGAATGANRPFQMIAIGY